MESISTKVHGILDYVVGILLIAAPWLFGFYLNGPETWVPVSLGAATILYSLLTKYELGVVHWIPMKTHLLLDFVGGLFLATSPWIFNFEETIMLPHLLAGILEIMVSLVSNAIPEFANSDRATSGSTIR